MDFWRFSRTGLDLSAPIEGSYDPRLVFLSFVVATTAAYAALEIVERAGAVRSARARGLWVAAGAVCMGCGVWAMHFVGMLSFRLPLEMEYDLVWTVLSALPAIVASGVVVRMLSERRVSGRGLHVAGVVMGVGIGTMHYTGMEAMRMGAVLRYDPAMFGLSVLVAYALATSAFWAEAAVGRGGGESRIEAQTLGAVILGASVCGMHYTAMRATEIYADPTSTPVSGMIFSPFALSVAILVVITVVTGVVVGGAFTDRRLQRALSDVARLERLLPICAWCRRISDEDGAWLDLEAYVRTRERTEVTHGICPACADNHFEEKLA